MNIGQNTVVHSNTYTTVQHSKVSSKNFKKILANTPKDTFQKDSYVKVQEHEKKLKPMGIGHIIGKTHGRSYQIFFAEESTPENPIAKTSLGDTIKINDIDLNNATELEMRVYCSYLDYIGQGSGGTFGTYSDLHVALGNAIGLPEDCSGDNNRYRTVRRDWMDITKTAMNNVKECDQKLYDIFDKMLSAITTYNNKP